MRTMTKEREVLPAPKKRASRKSNNVGGVKGKQAEFFGLPIKEAKEHLTIPLLQADVDKAMASQAGGVNDQENFLACVIAQASARVCGAERAAIMRRTAYVAFPGDGCARRYTVTDKSRAVLEAWDRGEPVTTGVALELKAPSKSRTRAGMRVENEKYRAKHGNGKTKKTGRKQNPPDPLHSIVRSGNLVRWD